MIEGKILAKIEIVSKSVVAALLILMNYQIICSNIGKTILSLYNFIIHESHDCNYEMLISLCVSECRYKTCSLTYNMSEFKDA